MKPSALSRPATALIAAAHFLASPATFAAPPAENWNAECVGRMQISLPGEVEVAAILPEDHIKNLLGGQSPIGYKFPDGQDASWSSSGHLTVTHPIRPDQKEDIDKAIAESWKGAQKYAKEKGGGYVLTELEKSEYVSRAWLGNDYYQAYLYVDDVAVDWGASIVSEDNNGMTRMELRYQTLLSGLRPRPLFDVPAEPGVCLPYLFIRDDGKQGRHIGMTYRLKAHPDITIWLEDSSAGPKDRRLNPLGHSTEAMINYFWNQDYYHRGIETQWPLRRVMKDTTLAGQPGGKTFVRITRDDKARTTDYGYLAAARGDPDAREDRPDLMLYVIQDSINATKQGIAPLTKKQFIDMAEKIAASVTRRGTGGTDEGR